MNIIPVLLLQTRCSNCYIIAFLGGETYCKRNNLSNGHWVRFKYTDYEKVHNMEHNGVDEHINVIGFGQRNQYFCAIKRHVLHLNSTKESSLKKEGLILEQLNKLIHMVQYR